jgi:hypothetical protein
MSKDAIMMMMMMMMMMSWVMHDVTRFNSGQVRAKLSETSAIDIG